MASRIRSARNYARPAPTRDPYDYVLIICEGGKTEPYYFNSLISTEGLSSANIHVTSGNGHTDPISIVRIGEENLSRGYDKIFCVFDRDGHANYDQALARIVGQEAGKNGKLNAITSWPCFEIWFLLHFRFSSSPFQKTGTRSPGDNTIKELKKYIVDYSKGRKTIFDEIAPRTETAIRNAKRLVQDNKKTGSTNPSTNAFELVQYLKNLKNGYPLE